MTSNSDFPITGCANCRHLEKLGFDIAMAFQPVVDVDSKTVFAQEALVRGPNGESSEKVFARVNEDNLYRFDQSCRVKAIETAATLGLQERLSINFMPNAVYRAESCIQATLEAASRVSFPVDRIIFEITEVDRVRDKTHLRNIIEYYQKRGFMTAIDDFGAGYAGLNLLADFVPDLVKLDMDLVRGLEAHPTRRAIVEHMLSLCQSLGVQVIAEGVETEETFRVLRDMGVTLFQGYWFARPAFQALPVPERFGD